MKNEQSLVFIQYFTFHLTSFCAQKLDVQVFSVEKTSQSISFRLDINVFGYKTPCQIVCFMPSDFKTDRWGKGPKILNLDKRIADS